MKKMFIAAALAALVLTLSGHAKAAFPEQPITLVVPFSAGGSTDLDARAFATVASKYMGQPVMVANKPGGSGIIGSQFVNQAKPDGYTILIGRPGAPGVATACFPETTPFTLDSFTFLGMLDQCPLVLMVRPDAPYKNVAELIEYIKANPGQVKYSSSGVNSIHNLATQNMLNKFGLTPDAVVHVPYKGGADALTAVMGGQADMMICAFNEADSFIKAGNLKPLVVFTNEPFPFAADVPTLKEANMPELELGTWFALLGPADMPQDLKDKYWEVIQQVVADPDYQKMIANISSVPMLMNGAEAKDYVVKVNDTFRDVGKAIGIVK